MINHNVITVECFWLICTIIKKWGKKSLFSGKILAYLHATNPGYRMVAWCQKIASSGELDSDMPLSFFYISFNLPRKYISKAFHTYFILSFLLAIQICFSVTFTNIYQHIAVVHYSYEISEYWNFYETTRHFNVFKRQWRSISDIAV